MPDIFVTLETECGIWAIYNHWDEQRFLGCENDSKDAENRPLQDTDKRYAYEKTPAHATCYFPIVDDG